MTMQTDWRSGRKVINSHNQDESQPDNRSDLEKGYTSNKIAENQMMVDGRRERSWMPEDD